MKKYLSQNFSYLAAILFASICFAGAGVYRLYSLNKYGITISLILAGVIFFIFSYFLILKNHRNKEYFAKKEAKINNEKRFPLFPIILAYFIFYSACLYLLFTSRTSQAIISPWEVVPSYFFILYFLATAILIFIIISREKIGLALTLISLHYFLSFSVALLVYRIGYGFDPFIHQATAELIDKTGAVYPKPFYYLGQYSLTIILHNLTAISIFWLDKLLAPVLAAVLLPAAIFHFLEKWFSDKKISLLLIVSVLILPFSFFVVTTPQNLAYLFLLLAIFYGFYCSNITELAAVYLLALASFSSHPLAGIPALFFAIALTIFFSEKEKNKKYFYFLVFAFSSLALPLSFYLINKNSPVPAASDSPASLELLNKIAVPGQENFILNFIYLYGFNIKIIIGLFIAIGLIIACRNRRTCKIYFLNLIISVSLIIAYILTSYLPFSFLISYERSDYLERILVLIILFSSPFIFVSLYGLLEKILEQKKAIKIPFLVFLAILITASLYLSYPRFDRYYNSRGYSTGEKDIESAHWVENDAKGDNYIVLANQQVSAAALREFGFNRYYPLDKGGEGDLNEIYFYPIPTGGQLYQYYLDMVYKKPDKKTMDSAMDFADVNESYFILNKYWWAFDKILAEAKLEADSWSEIGDGEIYIFKYKK